MDVGTLTNKLKEQQLPIGHYAVFGSAVMAIKGIREAPNIDVIVTDKLWSELQEKGYKPDHEGFIRIGNIKISNWWFAPTRKDIPTMISEAENISGIPFVNLEEVLSYKKALNREKDINDVRLIEQFLGSVSSSDEPAALSYDDYKQILDGFVQEAINKHGDSVNSMILFGSASRGQAKGSSDLDVFVFFDDSKIGRDQIANSFTRIIRMLRSNPEYNRLAGLKIFPEIYPFLISKTKASDLLWVFFDATEDGVILYDKNDFGKNLIKDAKTKILKTGGKRVKLPNGKFCWVLFKDFSQILSGPLQI